MTKSKLKPKPNPQDALCECSPLYITQTIAGKHWLYKFLVNDERVFIRKLQAIRFKHSKHETAIDIPANPIVFGDIRSLIDKLEAVEVFQFPELVDPIFQLVEELTKTSGAKA